MSNLSEMRAQLINFECYDNNNRLLGIVTVDLPDLQYSTADQKGAGIMGTISNPTLGETDSLEITLNWRSVNEDVTKLNRPNAHDLILYGANQIYNHTTGLVRVQQVKIAFRGLTKQTTLGSLQVAENTESKSVFEVVRLRIDIDGEEAILIDKLNYTYRVNGTDWLAEVRSALGLDW